MSQALVFFLLLLAGFGLGLLFFGGLWWTVRALPASRYPAILMMGSFWIRTGLVIAGLLLAMDGHWQRALACLLGFMLARPALSRWIPREPPAGRKAA